MDQLLRQRILETYVPKMPKVNEAKPKVVVVSPASVLLNSVQQMKITSTSPKPAREPRKARDKSQSPKPVQETKDSKPKSSSSKKVVYDSNSDKTKAVRSNVDKVAKGGRPKTDAKNKRTQKSPISKGKAVDRKKGAGTFNKAGDAVKEPTGKETKASAEKDVTLANPLFVTGASTTAVPVDVYANQIQSPQNKIKSVLGDVIGAINKRLGGVLSGKLSQYSKTFGVLGNIADRGKIGAVFDTLKKDILNGVPLTKDGLGKVLEEGLGLTKEVFNLKENWRDLRQNMMDDITSILDGKTGLVSLYGDVRKVLNGDLSFTEGLFQIIENITGNTELGKFLDLENEFKIIKAITGTIANFGGKEIFKKLFDRVHPEKKDEYIHGGIIDTVMQGDIEFLLFAIEEGYDITKILAIYPDLIRRLVSEYQPRYNDNDIFNIASHERLMTVLAKINPTWYYLDGTKKYDIELFRLFNDMATEALIQTRNRTLISMLAASEFIFPEIDILEELERYDLLIRGEQYA